MKNQNVLMKIKIFILVMLLPFSVVQETKSIDDKTKLTLEIVGPVLGAALLGTGIYLLIRSRRPKLEEQLKNSKSPQETKSILEETAKAVTKDEGDILKAQEVQTAKEEGRVPDEAQISQAVDNLMKSDLVQDQVRAQVNQQAEIVGKKENLPFEDVMQPILQDKENFVNELKGKLNTALKNGDASQATIELLNDLKDAGVDIADLLINSPDFKNLKVKDMLNMVNSIDKNNPNYEKLRRIPQQINVKKDRAIKTAKNWSKRLYESSLGKDNPEVGKTEVATRLAIDDFRLRYLKDFLAEQGLTEDQITQAIKDTNIEKTLQTYKDKIKAYLEVNGIDTNKLTDFETNVSKIYGEKVSPQIQAENVKVEQAIETQKTPDVIKAEAQIIQIDKGAEPKVGYKPEPVKALLGQIESFDKAALKVAQKIVKPVDIMSKITALRSSMEHDIDDDIDIEESSGKAPDTIVKVAVQKGPDLVGKFLEDSIASFAKLSPKSGPVSFDAVSYLTDKGITPDKAKALALGDSYAQIGDYAFKFDNQGKFIDSMPMKKFNTDMKAKPDTFKLGGTWDDFEGTFKPLDIGGLLPGGFEPIGGGEPFGQTYSQPPIEPPMIAPL